MTPGMRVCSPLYPTAGILRGIFDFELGHRETSDKWLFVFRGGESIIIVPLFKQQQQIAQLSILYLYVNK